MKKKIAKIFATIIFMATASANIGCMWLWAEEPKALNSMID